ncbi:hypothetical protein, partial [Pseudomonas aeruginosa]|uniref:hypothetical protein n=1 Tax=Pseudomonas aeruginosa TaxID=287 RepID=UPI003981EC30
KVKLFHNKTLLQNKCKRVKMGQRKVRMADMRTDAPWRAVPTALSVSSLENLEIPEVGRELRGSHW